MMRGFKNEKLGNAAVPRFCSLREWHHAMFARPCDDAVAAYRHDRPYAAPRALQS
jgi:hypothetical protein